MVTGRSARLSEAISLVLLVVGWVLVIWGVLGVAYVTLIGLAVQGAPQLHFNEPDFPWGEYIRVAAIYGLPLPFGIAALVFSRILNTERN